MNKDQNQKLPALGLMAMGHNGVNLYKGQEKEIERKPSAKRKTLLIGWDALDWKLVNLFRQKGIMPTLDKLIKTGVSGKIATLDPAFSPMLWTSVATGKTADNHGILGFIEKNGDGIRPIHGSSRNTRAIWNVFSNKNLKSNIINWWPTHPAEHINGTMISDLAFKGLKKASNKKPFSFLEGGVYPNEASALLEKYCLTPASISFEQAAPFLPDATQELLNKEKALIINLLKILSSCFSVHAVTTKLMTSTDWDFTAVYHDAIDHACHGFMKFHPPKLDKVPNEQFKLFHYVVEAMYRFHDMMLERLINLAGENTDVIIMSDHGFHSDHLRPTHIPKIDAGPALEHAQFGVLVMNGPSFKKNNTVTSASLLDIAPTLLHINNLPVGQDMNGKVLTQGLAVQKEIKTIPSWDQVAGEFGEKRQETDSNSSKQVDDDTLVQLIELGYINEDVKNLKGLEHKAEIHQLYNLARVYMNKNEMARAIFILNELYQKDEKDIRYGIALINCYLAINEPEEARIILNKFKAGNKNPSVNLLLLEARVLKDERKFVQALQVLKKAAVYKKNNPNILIDMGFTEISISKYTEALESFNKALTLDPENSRTFVGKALAHLNLDQLNEAIESALNAIDLVYAFPKAHAVLGDAFEQAELFTEAANAYSISLKFAPNNKNVRAKLIHIYEEHLNNIGAANEQRKQLETPLKEVIIVSGLPRSGTSMMMQQLEAGGIPILTDSLRKADESNPKGYYEYEPVKSLASNAVWLPKADKKAVKIVAPLLRYLPQNFKYKVIFMKRDINKIIRSQQIMLGKNPNEIPLAIYNSFKQEIKNLALWQKLHPNAEILEINYTEVISNPEGTSLKIQSFLNKKIDINAMIEAVNPELHRNK